MSRRDVRHLAARRRLLPGRCPAVPRQRDPDAAGDLQPGPALDSLPAAASGPRTVALCDLYQTFGYADAVAWTLRRLLRFRPKVQRAAELYVESSRPLLWNQQQQSGTSRAGIEDSASFEPSGGYTTVGVHVRRGDFLAPSHRRWGLTVVDAHYLNSSFLYFIRRRRLERTHSVHSRY